jgi:hypothetical protein
MKKKAKQKAAVVRRIGRALTFVVVVVYQLNSSIRLLASLR